MPVKLIQFRPMFLCTRKDYSDQRLLFEHEAFELDTRLWWVDEKIEEGHSPLAKLDFVMRPLPYKGFENFHYTREIHHPVQMVGVYVGLEEI